MSKAEWNFSKNSSVLVAWAVFNPVARRKSIHLLFQVTRLFWIMVHDYTSKRIFKTDILKEANSVHLCHDCVVYTDLRNF